MISFDDAVFDRRLRASLKALSPAKGLMCAKVLSLFLFLLLTLSPACAQQFATLRLTVTDPQGGAIARAKVSVRNVDTGVLHDITSDSTGVVNIPGLPAGEYRLLIDADAFAPYQAPLALTLG